MSSQHTQIGAILVATAHELPDGNVERVYCRKPVDIKTSSIYASVIMRTTLTIDDDVALLLERVRSRKTVPFRKLVNDALRLGLQRMAKPETAPESRVYTKPVHTGPALIPIVSISEALASAEGEDFK
ncbi:hypothetical protein DYH09_33220 [bacterium CPR1]|nr:hypothetical protein [bacterium CPR1]